MQEISRGRIFDGHRVQPPSPLTAIISASVYYYVEQVSHYRGSVIYVALQLVFTHQHPPIPNLSSQNNYLVGNHAMISHGIVYFTIILALTKHTQKHNIILYSFHHVYSTHFIALIYVLFNTTFYSKSDKNVNFFSILG